jgi:hypothetical protein
LLPALILCISTQDASDLVKKFEAFVNNDKGYSCSVLVTSPQYPKPLKGKISGKKPNFFNFRLANEHVDYQYIASPKGAIEIDHVEKTFYEFGPFPRIFVPRGFFSALPLFTIPVPYISFSMEKAFPGYKNSLKTIGMDTVNGSLATHVQINVSEKMDFWFDNEGRLVKYVQYFQNPGSEPMPVNFVFSDFGVASESGFNVEPPKGYQAEVLKRILYPPEIGTKLPKLSWKKPDGSAYPLTISKPTLFVFAEENCEISPKLQPVLESIKQKVTTIVVSSTGVSKLKGSVTLRLTLEELRGIGIDGSPFLLLVDKSGTVLWEDSGFVKGTEKQIQEAILKKVESIK